MCVFIVNKTILTNFFFIYMCSFIFHICMRNFSTFYYLLFVTHPKRYLYFVRLLLLLLCVFTNFYFIVFLCVLRMSWVVCHLKAASHITHKVYLHTKTHTHLQYNTHLYSQIFIYLFLCPLTLNNTHK